MVPAFDGEHIFCPFLYLSMATTTTARLQLYYREAAVFFCVRRVIKFECLWWPPTNARTLDTINLSVYLSCLVHALRVPNIKLIPRLWSADRTDASISPLSRTCTQIPAHAQIP